MIIKMETSKLNTAAKMQKRTIQGEGISIFRRYSGRILSKKKFL